MVPFPFPTEYDLRRFANPRIQPFPLPVQCQPIPDKTLTGQFQRLIHFQGTNQLLWFIRTFRYPPGLSLGPFVAAFDSFAFVVIAFFVPAIGSFQCVDSGLPEDSGVVFVKLPLSEVISNVKVIEWAEGRDSISVDRK